MSFSSLLVSYFVSAGDEGNCIAVEGKSETEQQNFRKTLFQASLALNPASHYV